MISSTQTRLAILMLLVITAAGGYLRFAHLTAYNLLQEELNHWYVGHELAKGGPPVLPSGRWYSRGIEYSRIVPFVSEHVASPELAARLPSALIGSLCLIVMGIGAWLMAGPWAAVGATFLLAVYPDAVTQSRLGRFYMLQLLITQFAFFGGWLLLLHQRSITQYVKWIGLIAVTLALLLAARIQVTALLTLLAWWLCLVGVGIWDVTRGGISWRRSTPLQLAATMLIILAGMLVLDPGLVDTVIARALTLPYWARVRSSSVAFYLRRLGEDFNIMVAFAPVAFTYLLLRCRTLGAYLLLMFGVPAIAFSLLLPFKAERFLLLAMPPLFIATAAAWVALLRMLYQRAAKASLLRWRFSDRQRHGAAIAVVILTTLTVLATMRAPRTAWHGQWNRIEPLWREAGAIIQGRRDLAALPFGATKSLPPRFYWGRVDFNIGKNFLEQWSFVPLGEAGVPSGRVGAYVTLPVGSPDLYAGVPVLTTVESIRQRFRNAGGVVIGIDGQARYFRMIDAELERVLASDAEEICRGRCGSLHVYHWRFR